MGAQGVIRPGFGGAFRGKRVLLTGQTGFKGGWLALWLERLGAEVTGIALPPATTPALYDLAGVAGRCDSRMADLRDARALKDAVGDLRPDLIIHMAAQAVLREGYDDPVGTFSSNVMGTAHMLEIARRLPALKGVIVVSSDKCYENREWDWGYRECDPLGGDEPYSASKACAELVAQSYARAFFHDPQGPQLATARAGNVIGGGDWAAHRLIPDLIRAIGSGKDMALRNPMALRPWQHVLEPLAGYLTLGARMLAPGGARVSGAWNFGPDADAAQPVGAICRGLAQLWPGAAPPVARHQETQAPPEARVLRLDSTKARLHLGWRPRLSLTEALEMTAIWYHAHLSGADMEALTLRQIADYETRLTGSAAPLGAAPAFAAE